MEPVPWRDAWQQALYGAGGFYRSAGGPAGHFTTATQGPPGRRLAEALARLADREGLRAVVDVGAGRGELLTHLSSSGAALQLTGVDVVERPDALPEEVRWVTAVGGPALPEELDDLDGVLVVAHEWLDVVPCTVAEVDAAGVLREVCVDPLTGAETTGVPLEGAERDWADLHWPARQPGHRVEVGLARDDAWRKLLSRIRSGVAVAVDYGHRQVERPTFGTLTAYRQGARVAPVPDGTCDLTAHVAMDTLEHDELLDQRTALRLLGLGGPPPEHALPLADPGAYLRALEDASADGALMARGGFGDFLWAVKRVRGDTRPPWGRLAR